MRRTSRPPKWIKPQLTRLVEEAPAGNEWQHEIKYDGYRMHARIDGEKATLLTRTGLDWSHRYKRTIEALGSLKVKSTYLDGELCASMVMACPCSSARCCWGTTRTTKAALRRPRGHWHDAQGAEAIGGGFGAPARAKDALSGATAT